MTNKYDDAIKDAVLIHLPHGYDWRLYKCQLIAESGLNPEAVSQVGAKGIAQFMPKTWVQIRNELRFPRYSSAHNPEYAIIAGAYYMNKLIGKWSSPQRCADNVNGYREIIAGLYQITGKNSHETSTYVKRILALYIKLVVG